METSRKLPLSKIFYDAWDYMVSFKRINLILIAVNFVFLVFGFEVIGGWANPLFLVWAGAYYIFWMYFFRQYFDRKPYLLFDRTIVDSLVPSTKILFIGFIVVTILALLPFIPLFVLPLEQAEFYENFLKKYMQDSKAVDLILMLILTVFSPVILVRPFMAWISSVIGRSGAIKTAWARTENNHWRMVLMILILNMPFSVLQQLEFMYAVPHWLIWFLASPFIIYLNVVLAKSYEFFYMEN